MILVVSVSASFGSGSQPIPPAPAGAEAVDSNNIESGRARMGGNPFEVQERYIEQSPFFHLDKVTTPVLITHGVKDATILFAEGEMMFYALRRLGKTAEFVIYNEGDHSLSRPLA